MLTLYFVQLALALHSRSSRMANHPCLWLVSKTQPSAHPRPAKVNGALSPVSMVLPETPKDVHTLRKARVYVQLLSKPSMTSALSKPMVAMYPSAYQRRNAKPRTSVSTPKSAIRPKLVLHIPSRYGTLVRYFLGTPLRTTRIECSGTRDRKSTRLNSSHVKI